MSASRTEMLPACFRSRKPDVWRRLESTYGPIVRNETMKTMEIEGDRLIIRATLLANPITVFRKRLCVAADIERFHTLVGYPEGDDVQPQ